MTRQRQPEEAFDQIVISKEKALYYTASICDLFVSRDDPLMS